MRTNIRTAISLAILIPIQALAGERSADTTKVDGQLRYRSEWVTDDSLPLDSVATTLRTRLTLTERLSSAWRAIVELDDLRALDQGAYNSTVNGPTNRPIVADPVGTNVNRALIEMHTQRVDLTLGRQSLTIDDQRFIGNAGWRQNEQTYDGVVLRARPTAGTDVTVGWLRNINRFYGPNHGTQAAYWHGNSWVANIKRDIGRYGTISAFSYQLRFDDSPATSNGTNGLTWRNKIVLDAEWSLPWSVSFARQTDAGSNPTNYSTDYRRVELGVTRGAASIKVGQETLGGNAVKAGHRFQTPLASLHAFQGWADKFTTTPTNGVDDRYSIVDFDWHGYKVVGAYHDYSAAAIHRAYGREWDMSVSKKLTKRIEIVGKYADYSAQGFAADTTKGWLMVTATF